MEIVLYIFCFTVVPLGMVELLRPILKRKQLKDKLKIKFISPIGNYIIFFVMFFVMIYFLYLFIMQKDINQLILFAGTYTILAIQLSKSYVIMCKEGILLNGTYFSFEEKRKGQRVSDVIGRRIYEINTDKKRAYVYVSKKYMDEIRKYDVFR